jgi:hypothetical protein
LSDDSEEGNERDDFDEENNEIIHARYLQRIAELKNERDALLSTSSELQKKSVTLMGREKKTIQGLNLE